MPRSSASWLLAVGACWLLSGCVAAIVPIAAGGLTGRTVIHHRHRTSDARATPVEADAPASAPAIAAEPVRPTPAPPAEAPRVLAARPATPVAPPSFPSPPAAAAKPAEAPEVGMETSWDSIARQMAKIAARTPDRLKADVLQQGQGKQAPCGARPVAVAIDTATLGSGDYLFVGALYTMGYEIVLMARSATLPPARIAALAKQGVTARLPGKTLFASPSGGEAAARAAIAKQWCVAGLVGNRAADFPGAVLPGTSGARDGWFLVATQHPTLAPAGAASPARQPRKP